MKILLDKCLKPNDIDIQKDPPTSAQPPAVFRLSDDILSSVFLLNVDKPINPDDWFNGYLTNHLRLPPTTPQLTTRLTSQVCRRWRIVALTCPALWSNIELSPRYFQWVQEMIQRAIMRDGFGRVSLTCCSEDAFSQITPQLLSHTSSYRGMASREQWCLLTNELASPTTPLECLSVIPANPYDWANMKLTPSLTLAKPGLKTLLCDSYFPIDITQPNLSSLTSLLIIIRNKYSIYLASTVPRQKTSDILCALANMPLLEELSVSVSPQNTIDSIHSVHLPCLARLKLDGSYFLISQLLGNINFPLSCSLHISCEEDEYVILPTDDMIYHIVTPVARNMAYGFTHNLRINFSYTLFSIEDLSLMPNITMPRDPGESDVWSTQLQCSHSHYTIDDWKSILDRMLAIFYDVFQTTTHLTLDLSAPSCFADLIPRFLQSFTELVTINLNGRRGFEQFSRFKVTSENEQGDFLLALHNVKVLGLSAGLRSLDSLIDFLAWRLDQNRGLHTLDLYFDSTDVRTQVINIKKRQLSRLQQLVVNINFYHILGFGSRNASLIKAVISHPTFGSAGGRCRLERFRDVSDDELSNEHAKKRKIFRILGRWR